MNRVAIALSAGVVLAGMLGGCGRRGALEAPGTPAVAGTSEQQPSGQKQSPGGRYSLGGQKSAASDDVETPPIAPKRDFFLDRIL